MVMLAAATIVIKREGKEAGKKGSYMEFTSLILGRGRAVDRRTLGGILSAQVDNWSALIQCAARSPTRQ